MSDSVAGSGLRVTSKRFEQLTTTELHEILRLRSEVFVVEQRCVYADVDGRDVDPETTHHWLQRGGELAAYARVLREQGPWRIGRVVTAPPHRGAGLAAALITYLRDTLAGPIALDAQTHLVGWYERLGFSVSGVEFIEDGIPHTPMTRGA